MDLTRRVLPLALGVLAAVAAPAAAQTGADFYKGKTVTYIVATSAGGGYDAYGRLVAEFMQKHLPGSTFVVRNIPGAGHIIGANAIYNARPDGLTIGTFNTGLIYNQLVGRKEIKFDLTKMSWIGKAASDPRVFVIHSSSPIKSFKDLRAAKGPVNFATSGVGSASYVETKILADALDLPLKIIAGYSGTEDMMAMRRNEIAGIIGSRSSFEDFVKNGYARFVAQIGGKQGDVPQLASLVDDPEGKAMVALIQSQGEIGRLTAAAPAIPADRLQALRNAYRQALEDKQLQALAAKTGRPLDPAVGVEVEKMVKQALSQSPKTVALLVAALEVKPQTAKAGGKLLEVQNKGRAIVFNGPDGKPVKSEPSGSRTKITIAGKDAKRGDLKAGMNCDIEYKPGGDNEPVTIACK
jgi:tripartite-type tricarboxylate transporter receptor subunit TctC